MIWPQTHTWRWFLSGLAISDLSSINTLEYDSCLVCNQCFDLQTRTWKWWLFCSVISDLTPNTHLTMILVWFWNQWFVFKTYTWWWVLSGFGISDLSSKHTLNNLTMILVWFVISFLLPKRALDNDSCFVLQSVILPQTLTWRWF